MEKGTIIIQPFMYKKLHLTLPEMAVYAIINGYSENNKNCFVSLTEMSKMTKLNSVSICRILKRLTEKGYIRKTVISTRKVEYTITPLDELTGKWLIRQTKEKAVDTSPPKISSISENIENNTTMKTENELKKEHDRVYQEVLKKANKK